ncbi:hypothetical protein SBC2_84120 (plasmid) [Caballeronia sp. SBC2]|nr:hypothetical protein SBC2_84120 [Caballeronia sp. SBC2]
MRCAKRGDGHQRFRHDQCSRAARLSRKFVYGQAHKADLALDNVCCPMECENVRSSHPEPKLSLPMDMETDPVLSVYCGSKARVDFSQQVH